MVSMMTVVELGSPPRVRGIVVILTAVQYGFGITPACAGNRETASAVVVRRGDHPRVCGE